MNKTRQKTKEASNSFKAPAIGKISSTTHNSSDGAIYLIRKKPKPIKELKEEYEK